MPPPTRRTWGPSALADLAAAAAGKNYRIIGGHMVHILSHVYPTEAAVARVRRTRMRAPLAVDLLVPLTTGPRMDTVYSQSIA
ncbi:hypothetical protein [Rhodococcus jostii]|uniref:hypothetical protein n=1 Tax=Rhodococcus jostii TaxID=132919 RepID=UPI0005A24D0A|nr:hypothetical protein [Rhodococcus jostii]